MGIEMWKNVKPLEDPDAIKNIEQSYSFTLPDDIKACIVSNNGGRPVPNAIKLMNGQENDVKCLLSYNQGDVENIYNVIDYFKNKYSSLLIPFAMDSGGNYYCMNGAKIVLWTQEEEVFPVCSNFHQFLNSLQSGE